MSNRNNNNNAWPKNFFPVYFRFYYTYANDYDHVYVIDLQVRYTIYAKRDVARESDTAPEH